MSTDVSTIRLLTGIARRLAAEHDSIVKSAGTTIEHASRAGNLLLEAKGLLKHGEWSDWLKANFAGSKTTACNYMRVADHWEELKAQIGSVADLSLNSTVKLLAKPRAALPAPEPDVEEPNPPETPDSPPEPLTSLHSVPADEDGLDDNPDPGERLAGASVAGEPPNSFADYLDAAVDRWLFDYPDFSLIELASALEYKAGEVRDGMETE
jgi:hypothetical protein